MGEVGAQRRLANRLLLRIPRAGEANIQEEVAGLVASGVADSATDQMRLRRGAQAGERFAPRLGRGDGLVEVSGTGRVVVRGLQSLEGVRLCDLLRLERVEAGGVGVLGLGHLVGDLAESSGGPADLIHEVAGQRLATRHGLADGFYRHGYVSFSSG